MSCEHAGEACSTCWVSCALPPGLPQVARRATSTRSRRPLRSSTRSTRSASKGSRRRERTCTLCTRFPACAAACLRTLARFMLGAEVRVARCAQIFARYYQRFTGMSQDEVERNTCRDFFMTPEVAQVGHGLSGSSPRERPGTDRMLPWRRAMAGSACNRRALRSTHATAANASALAPLRAVARHHRRHHPRQGRLHGAARRGPTGEAGAGPQPYSHG